jgi:transposase
VPPARYVRLNATEVSGLETLYRQTKEADLRTRCQMILLSAQGYSVADIAKLTLFDQDTILFWFDRYEADALAGLEDRPHPGRPPKSGRSLSTGPA